MFVSTEDVGAYAVAYTLIFAFATVSHSINLAVFPTMTRQRAESDDLARATFSRVFWYLVFISVPIGVFVALNAEQIVGFLYGEELSGAAAPLTILAWVIPFMFLSEFLGYVAIVVDRETLAARANWIASILNVALNAALIPVIGVTAAAVMTVVTEVVITAEYAWALRNHDVFSGWQRTLVRTMIPVLTAAAAIVVLQRLNWDVIAIGAVCVPLYFGVAVATRAIGPDEWRFLRGLIAARQASEDSVS
jgi:O-antigen/teichoic acid export membrane protein